jgi:hypothetical protein
MDSEEMLALCAQELREMGEHPCRADLPMGKTLRDAADIIEALRVDREQVAAEERAKIVAWLREPDEYLLSEDNELRLMLANEIEAGEHIPLPETSNG